MFVATAILSCGLEPVKRETSLKGSVQLDTGEPVENYPLSVLATKGSFYGGRNLVSSQDFHTDKNGAFSYQGLHESGGLQSLGYNLQWTSNFRIQGQFYSVDTIQADYAGLQITPNYKFEG